eukprot:Skav210111  [mRNA]  locus=scaffold2194:62563:65494:+ [translate_table: standard]
MTRLSAAALDDVAAAFAGAGLSEARDQTSLTEVLLLVRSRIRSTTATADLHSQRVAIQRCVSPLIAWLEAEPDVAALPMEQKVELLWGIYSATVSRTSLADFFPLVCSNEETWNDVMSELWTVGPRATSVAPARNWFGVRKHWWLLLAGLVVLFDQYLASGRWRFYSMLFSTSCFGLAFALWYFFPGAPQPPHELPEQNPSWLHVRPPQTSQSHSDAGHAPHVHPPSAPPLPGNGQSSMRQPLTAPSASGLASGSRVLLNGTGTAAGLQGHYGTVMSVHGATCEVQLDLGLVLSQLPGDGLTMVPPRLNSMHGSLAGQPSDAAASAGLGSQQTPSGGFFAPFAADASAEVVKQQAKRLREALEKSAALQSTHPSWVQLFWQAVKNESDLVGLQERIKTMLQAHGYVGPSTCGPPRTDELKKQLAELEILGSPPHGTGGSLLQAPMPQAVSGATDPEQMAWHLKLPADMQRAGPEIYRNIRAEGVSSVRQWVNEQHSGLEARNTSRFQDLFTAATIIDFELANCQSEATLMSRNSTSKTWFLHLPPTHQGQERPSTNDWNVEENLVALSTEEEEEDQRDQERVAKEVAKEETVVEELGRRRADGLTPPSVSEFVSHNDVWPLLPLPLPEIRPWKPIRSCRLRDRQKKRLRVSRAAVGIIKVLNSLHYGHAYDPKLTSPEHSKVCHPCVTPARALAVKHVLNKAALEVRARRDFGLTGVRALASLLKAPLDESGYVRPAGVRQVPMNADAMVEPQHTGYIDMLDALPADDRVYYQGEVHVVESMGKSEVLFKEIEAHYGFVGGEQAEFLKYLRREDVQRLWEWDLMTNVRAIAGVSTVLKKNGTDQRKLIMQCAANYMFGDPSLRANLGMGGGSALARVFLKNDKMSVAACDEDSAFTYVKVPEWMARWQAAPPMLAVDA